MLKLVATLLPVVLTFSSAAAARPGAYQAIGVDEGDVRAAADFAVKKEATITGERLVLKAIEEPQKQIVAGTNYQFVLVVDELAKQRRARVKVFRALNQHYELKLWDWIRNAEN